MTLVKCFIIFNVLYTCKKMTTHKTMTYV